MSKPVNQSKAVLVIAFMYNNKEKYENAIKIAIKIFGKINIISDEYDFSHSKYYKNEMGDNLRKRFIAFDKMISRDYIVKVKKITDKIEKINCEKERRTVNIDPAILTLENFVLVTNKNFTHRIYIKDNVFADLTLIYKKDSGYNDLPWTYADYSSEETKKFLNKIRSIFYERLIKTSPFAGKNERY